MAGMFYSLQEAAKKLGKSEDEVRKLASTNKLRLFRDGSNLLFKIDEVNTLAAERLDDEDLGLELEPAEPGTDIFASPETPEAKEPTEEDMLLDLGEDTPVVEPEADLAAEPTGEEPTAELDAGSPGPGIGALRRADHEGREIGHRSGRRRRVGAGPRRGHCPPQRPTRICWPV